MEGFFHTMQNPGLIDHLFRTEFSKITAVLCKLLGIEHMETAEDIAGETLLSALETWPYQDVPATPTAWLYAVAKNKAKNHITRKNIFADKIISAVSSSLFKEYKFDVEIDLSDKNIADSQLQMLFAICNPIISIEAQTGLALRILCGFGIDEIANAFLSNRETINKRLFRAKEKLRTGKVKIEVPPQSEINNRIDAVLTTLYLLFNEGYYSESRDTILRKDLCLEAMRLTYMLVENEQTNLPVVNSLLALMCFHSSRFEARKNDKGEMILYDDQDESLWDQELIAKGAYYLNKASQGSEIHGYHLEASIAWWHTHKADTPEKWENILHLFNQLLSTEYSPIVALNRTYAVSKVRGNAAGIIEAEKLNLTDNHFYFTLLGELYKDIDIQKAKQHFAQAFSLAKTSADKRLIQQKIDKL